MENIEHSTDVIADHKGSQISEFELAQKIDEAIMEDNPYKFHKLRLKTNQIIEFVYIIQGPKRSFVSRSEINQDDINMLNYNIVMMACQYGSIKILNYLYSDVVCMSSDPRETKRRLLISHKPTRGGIQAVHLACYLGDLDILRILKDKLNADFMVTTKHHLTPIHCAA